MMRLVQDVEFEETINAAAIEQVENKFEYYKSQMEVILIRGVYYVLRY
jgi:hypothetical protein